MRIDGRLIIPLAIAIVIFPLAAYASSPIARFIFITEPQSIHPGELSDDLVIQAQDSAGSLATTTETTDLEFSSTSSTGEFLNASGDPVRTVMNKGTANRTFYYRDSTSGAHALKVKATGRDSGQSREATQQIIVAGGGQSPQPASGDSSGSENTVQSSSVSSGGVSSPFQPTIKAYAGEDRTVVAGALTYLNASASDEKNEPFENARFWWNFGDGAAAEGRSVTHIFAAIGTYIAGLHISSGISSASDYLTVIVVPNQVAVASVVGGAEGFVRLKNPSEYVVDISGWHMSDASGRTFTLLPHTKLNARSEIAFQNSITGLLHDGDPAAVLYYPNGVRASDYSGSAVADSVGSGNIQGARQTAPRDAAHTAPTAEIKTKQRDPEDIPAEIVAPSEVSGKTELAAERAQASAPVRPSRALFLWIATGLSALAAGGFLLIKTIIMRNHE